MLINDTQAVLAEYINMLIIGTLAVLAAYVNMLINDTQAVLADADKNVDGKIDKAEFKKALEKNKPTKQKPWRCVCGRVVFQQQVT